MGGVLIIDDEEDVRTAIREVLTRAGYDVRTASDGQEGLAAQRQEPAAVVITDIIMPEKDGIEAIREIRKEFPEVKIIAISGGGGLSAVAYQPETIVTTAYLAAAKDVGADRIFTKPFNRTELIEAVAGLLTEQAL